MTLAAYDATKLIQHHYPGFTPKVGLALGSGMGPFIECIEDPVIIPYHELPDFHTPQVEGHSGYLYLGYVNKTPVACFQGRPHYYEGISGMVIKTMIRTLKLLGCNTYLATNAAGAIRIDWKPCDLVLIKDHINLQGHNPLVGPNEDTFGPRFPSMHDMYDPELRQLLRDTAKKLKMDLQEGVYIGVLGPSFETPAEINAYRILGADCVGMSTVPEVIVARHCGLRVIGISTITNSAAGVAEHALTHEETLENAHKSLEKLKRLILACISDFP